MAGDGGLPSLYLAVPRTLPTVGRRKTTIPISVMALSGESLAGSFLLSRFWYSGLEILGNFRAIPSPKNVSPRKRSNPQTPENREIFHGVKNRKNVRTLSPRPFTALLSGRFSFFWASLGQERKFSFQLIQQCDIDFLGRLFGFAVYGMTIYAISVHVHRMAHDALQGLFWERLRHV